MTDSKVVIFGSFTEDETRSIWRQISLQSGSSDFATVRSSSDFNVEPKQTDSSEGSKSVQPSKLITKDNALKNVNPARDVSERASGRVKENGVAFEEDNQKAWNGLVAAVRKLQRRGLSNSGNLCFCNATLQALLSCSSFVQLLQKLKTLNIPELEIVYPTLHAFVEFIRGFEMPTDSSLKKKDMMVPETGKPFTPSMFEPILKTFPPDRPNNMSGRARQEDAQEFLSFVMHKMHDELVKFEEHFPSISGGKSAVTRTQSVIQSELSAIFGGQLRSFMKAEGNMFQPIQPFQPLLLLQLDIFQEAVRNIEDALRLFSAPEPIQGYQTSAAGKDGVAIVSVKIETLPKIMILQLKRFSYNKSQGSTSKLCKPVRFPLELVMDPELLVSPSSKGRKYELVATITHHGKELSKGHYTADARYSDGQWLRCDDASVTPVDIKKVLHKQAYVLFYEQE